MPVLNDAILQADIRRYAELYRWSFNVIRKVINQKYGTRYETADIQAIAKCRSLPDSQ